MKNINWDVVWSVLRTLLVAGGPVATLLIALDFPPVLVGKWMAISLAAIGVLSVAIPGLKGALLRTDNGKVVAVSTMSPAAQAKVADVLPSEVKIAAVTALPDVTNVVVKDNASNGVGVALANPAEPKVVPVSST